MIFSSLSISNLDEMNSKGFWTGLRNTDKVTCEDDECVDQLYWRTGGKYEEHLGVRQVKMKRGNKCVRYNENKVIDDDIYCDDKRKYVCEFSCSINNG